MFEFPFMSFELRNAVQTFQHFVYEILRSLEFCFAYVDDIFVASSSPEEYLEHFQVLFE